MTNEKLLPRESMGGNILAAASGVMILADMVMHGLTSINVPLALLSIAFAYAMFKGKKVEDSLIAYYQKRSDAASNRTRMSPEVRFAILHLQARGLIAFWCVLIASSLAFSMTGNVSLSQLVIEVMIAYALVTIPMRAFVAALLFK